MERDKIGDIKMKMRLLNILCGLLLCCSLLCACNTSAETTADTEYIAYLEEHITQLEKYVKSIEKMVSNINDELIPEVTIEPVIEDKPAEPTSAYERWIEAEMTASERDMYESMYDGIYILEDEISRGWFDNGTRQYLTLIKGTKATIVDNNGVTSDIELATATASQLKQIWKSLEEYIDGTSYCIKDFFMVDEYGNSVNTGIYNFLRTIDQLENIQFNGANIVFTNDNGNVIGWDFDAVGGDTAIAKALGVSEEFVMIILHAAVDAGFIVDFE